MYTHLPDNSANAFSNSASSSAFVLGPFVLVSLDLPFPFAALETTGEEIP